MMRAVLVLLLAASMPLAAQRAPVGQELGRALDLERQGRYADAAEAFRRALAAEPTDPSALLGLERVLEPLGRSADIVGPARASVDRAPNGAAYSALVRGWVAGGQPDSARAAALAWRRVEPGELAPFRELVQAHLRGRDRTAAEREILWAREQSGLPAALSYEMAQIRASQGNWFAATEEWLAASRELAGYRQTALAALTPVPSRLRGDVLRAIEADTALGSRVLQGVLLGRWDRADEGVRQLVTALPANRARAIEALNEFSQQLRSLPRAQGARGVALEEIARRSSGDAAGRARVEAAQAYQAAGDQASARRMLGAIGTDQRGAAVSASATSTMIGVLLAEGDMERAERELAEAGARLPVDELQELRRRIANGWIRRGALDRAEALLATDSTVSGLAVRGRIALYRGDLAGGVRLLQAAGPFAGSREDATARTSLLALVQPIEADSLPALGAALLALERGDTVGAAAGFAELAGRLPVAKGGAELNLRAGRLRMAAGDTAGAEPLLRAAGAEAAPATAPAADLERARIYLATGRQPEAVALLEHLILTYPSSALVPQARRALDEAKGAVPAS